MELDEDDTKDELFRLLIRNINNSKYSFSLLDREFIKTIPLLDREAVKHYIKLKTYWIKMNTINEFVETNYKIKDTHRYITDEFSIYPKLRRVWFDYISVWCKTRCVYLEYKKMI